MLDTASALDDHSGADTEGRGIWIARFGGVRSTGSRAGPTSGPEVAGPARGLAPDRRRGASFASTVAFYFVAARLALVWRRRFAVAAFSRRARLGLTK